MENKKRRKQWSTATDYDLYEKLKGLSDKTRIPTTKLLDEAIEDLLVKYNILQKSDKKFFRTVMGKFRDIEKVTGNPCHNLPYFGIVKVAVGKLLQMLKRILAHVRLYLRPHYMAGVSHVKGGQPVHDPQKEIDPADL